MQLRSLVVLVMLAAASAFRTPMRMGMFDGFKGAFDNDSSLKKLDDYAGKNKVLVTFQPGNKVLECVAGQTLRDITRQAKMDVKYNCTKGECGTCEILVDGKKTRTCVSRLPAKPKVTIKV